MHRGAVGRLNILGECVGELVPQLVVEGAGVAVLEFGDLVDVDEGLGGHAGQS
ncbi:Uncharacterised protein [Mycobacteroides abscessus subsp. massiliense]|nr:Uncharacterised protein [Mycobacteroides abscessus subsp. massiliense]